jgi:hypothetical protein
MPVDRVIPKEWLPPAHVQRVIIHWTGGPYRATGVDLRHYHVLLVDEHALGIGKDVGPVRGVYTAADNDNCRDRRYAAHTARSNTGSFGLAAACMRHAVPGGPYGRYPLTHLLWERLAQAAAEVCLRYGLKVARETVLQHGEVEAVLGAPQNGKWDCLELPFAPELSRSEVCEQFRRKVHWFLAELRHREH